MNTYSKMTLLVSSLLSLLLVGCQQQDIDFAQPQAEPATVAQSTAPQGKERLDMIRVRFSPEMAARIEAALASPNGLRSASADVENFIRQMGALDLRRSFPHAGQFEERTRREGLHLWYNISLKEQASSAEALRAQQLALQLAEAHAGVSSVEPVYIMSLPKTQPVVVDVTNGSSLRTGTARPTNDPLLPMQWHYHNEGNFVRAVAGADVNLYKAWEIEKGKNTVIVSVVDGGIDTNHEDLVDNLWVNTGEIAGDGIDNDRNGYVDDVYGYNFVNNTGAIEGHDHGTHVAGTVGARNHNNRGVAGVAGGDGSVGSGVRLMSCQVFADDPNSEYDKTAPDFAVAIKYGADNGAVISQNSWGSPNSTYFPPSHKAAIDYFIKYAGCDNQGNQLPDSPMKGGVVIFAAGNENRDYLKGTSSYHEVVSVSAMAPNFRMSHYSTRGAWVTVMAPGGDLYYHNGQVLSTLPDNKYGYMQGTSMACPHVSGIAALIVSRFGGRGFTANELRTRLRNSVRDENINVYNPEYAGRLGAGYIDAYKALVSAPIANVAPQAVQWRDNQAEFTGLTLKWTVAEDANDVTAFGYKIYYSTSRLSSEADLANLTPIVYPQPSLRRGEVVSYTLTDLRGSTPYYFAVVPYDRWGSHGPAAFTSLTTRSNTAPSITLPDGTSVRLTGDETAEVRLPVSDPDGHSWTAEVVYPALGTTLVQQADAVVARLRVQAAPGIYEVVVRVTDQMGASDEVSIPLEIYQNQAPVQTTQMTALYIPITQERELNLNSFFSDPDGTALTYTVRALAKAGVTTSITGSTLKVRGSEVGRSVLEVSATDGKHTVKGLVEVEVASADLLQQLYPVPATTVLNMRLSTSQTTAEATIFSALGAKMLSDTISVDRQSGVAKLDISRLPAGSYVLELRAGEQTVRKSFIKR